LHLAIGSCPASALPLRTLDVGELLGRRCGEAAPQPAGSGEQPVK
jgi:hypothetical protein